MQFKFKFILLSVVIAYGSAVVSALPVQRASLVGLRGHDAFKALFARAEENTGQGSAKRYERPQRTPTGPRNPTPKGSLLSPAEAHSVEVPKQMTNVRPSSPGAPLVTELPHMTDTPPSSPSHVSAHLVEESHHADSSSLSGDQTHSVHTTAPTSAPPKLRRKPKGPRKNPTPRSKSFPKPPGTFKVKRAREAPKGGAIVYFARKPEETPKGAITWMRAKKPWEENTTSLATVHR